MQATNIGLICSGYQMVIGYRWPVVVRSMKVSKIGRVGLVNSTRYWMITLGFHDKNTEISFELCFWHVHDLF